MGRRSSKSDLGQTRREIFLQIGLDRANQIEAIEQIRRFGAKAR
jgi:hypothetical protein